MRFLHSLSLIAAATVLFSGCASQIPAPQSNWGQATGQIQSRGGKTAIVGEIAIRHDRENFLAEISKGPGVPLLTLYAKGAHGEQVSAKSSLSALGWSGSAANAPTALKAWAALPEVFHLAQARAAGDRGFALQLSDVKIISAKPTAVEYERNGETVICRLQH